MNDFNQMSLNETLKSTLESLNFTQPTPIQQKTIPLALEGRDIIGSAQTGTGKTAAFGLPIVEKLSRNEICTALIITPTRELAAQVMEQFKLFLGKMSGIKTALLIGGDHMPKQLHQLRKKPRLIVGTPGRINDHLKRGSLDLAKTNFLVLDETDRMLDMGFSIQIDAILEHMPEQRQTLLFSATMPNNIIKIAKKYLNNPERVSVDQGCSPVKRIKQDEKRIQEADKYSYLLSQLESRNGSIVVFVNTKFGTEKMAKRLLKDEQDAVAIHGDLRQHKRDRVIKAFRNSKYRILVATDVAARGLDIPHVEHVINYDLPQCPEDYIHRIGRTARAGAEGFALNLISSSDDAKWRAIERLINPNSKSSSQENSSSRKAGRGRKSFKRRGDKVESSGIRRSEKRGSRSEFSGRRRSEKEGSKVEFSDKRRSEKRGDKREFFDKKCSEDGRSNKKSFRRGKDQKQDMKHSSKPKMKKGSKRPFKKKLSKLAS